MSTDSGNPWTLLVALLALSLPFSSLPPQTTSSTQEKSSAKYNLQVNVTDSEAKAQRALVRLQKGEDFAAVAKEVSIDPNASAGGLLGEVDLATLRPELRQGLESLKAGQISNVIKVASGFVILKVLPPTEDPARQGMGGTQGAQGQGMGPNRDLNLAGRGAIQYPADVAGQVLADMLFQKFSKPAHWEQDFQEVCAIRKESLAGGIDGLDKINMPMGANFGDVDNDGYLDIYLATGGPEFGALAPKMLLHNDGGKHFTDITASSGTGDLHKGHGVAFADLGNNGHEDILTSTGGAVPGDAHAFRVYENPGNDNDWITVKLVGVKSNRAGIGARIKVTVENEGHGTRSIYRTVGSGGSFGASPIQQHIGLGKSANRQKF